MHDCPAIGGHSSFSFLSFFLSFFFNLVGVLFPWTLIYRAIKNACNNDQAQVTAWHWRRHWRYAGLGILQDLGAEQQPNLPPVVIEKKKKKKQHFNSWCLFWSSEDIRSCQAAGGALFVRVWSFELFSDVFLKCGQEARRLFMKLLSTCLTF